MLLFIQGYFKLIKSDSKGFNIVPKKLYLQ